MMATELSAAEAQVLLKPNRAAAGEAVKVTLLSLLAQGLVRIEEETKKGRFRVRKTVFVRPTDRTARALPPHAVSLLENVRAAQAVTGSMQDLVAQVRRAYGSGLEGFKKRFILPALESRGLIQKGRVLWIFPTYRLTPAGMAEKSRIESDIARARTNPGLLGSKPAEAAAIALAVGSAILLVPELRPHYRQLSDAMRSPADMHDVTSSGMYRPMSDGGDSSHDLSHADTHLDSAGLGGLGAFDLGSFDASAFDTLDSGMASFDASVGDSGGGGGDSGGGGGD
jgi:hypothetical protein